MREQYINLLTDIKSDRAGQRAERRDALINELKRIYAVAPDTSSSAYRRAQTALKISEDMTFSDDEIDRFLPNSLHAEASESPKGD